MNAILQFLGELATASLLVSILLAVFLPLRPLLRRMIGSQWLCVLWLALLARLLMPWPLESRWSLYNHWQSRAASAVAAAPLKITVSFPGDTDARDAYADIPAAALPVVAPVAVESHWNPLKTAGIVWLAGTAFCLGMLAWRWMQTVRLAAKTRPATDVRLRQLFESIPRELRRGTQLRMTDALAAPTLAGIFRPQIWMPLTWPAQFTDAELRNVLLHELGHARRRDLAVQWLFAIAQCIHWFNPLVWLAGRAARLDREMACDAWVLAHNTTGHMDYGSALVKAVQLLRDPLRTAPGAVAMASGRRSLRARISCIGTFQPFPAWRGALGVISMIAALAALTTGCKKEAQTPPPAAAPAVTQTPAIATETAGATHDPMIEVEVKFAEVNEDAWEKLRGENPAFADSKFPELAHEKPAFADLKDNLKEYEVGARELPEGEINQLPAISPAEFQKIIRSFDEAKGVELLSAPSVTTRHGQRAVVEVVREFRFPSEFGENKPFKAKGPDGETITATPFRFTPTAFATKNLGVTLEIQPELNKEGAIELGLVPTVASLIGYVTDENGTKTLGLNFRNDIPNHSMPVFSTSKGKIKTSILPGQTVLLGGVRLDYKGESLSREAGTPEYPPPNPDPSPEIARRILLVFVTARTIERDGTASAVQNSGTQGDAPGTNPKPVGIAGEIVAVNDGNHFTVINIGLHQGAVQNAEAEVKRGDQTVAMLRIDQIQPDLSIAGMILGSEAAGVRPMKGDKVILTGKTIPDGIPVPGKEGFVTSPYAPEKGMIDLRGYEKETQVKDPYTGKIFLAP